MRRTLGIAVCALALTGVCWPVQAGNLNPSAPPAPTMVTLQQMYDRVSASPVGVQKTGQTGCWNGTGGDLPCGGTGQDGESQAGVSVNPRFTDRGDGTVRDNLTGLIWLKDANCFPQGPWGPARTAAGDLEGVSGAWCTPPLLDGSVAGDWRLPNVRELFSLIDHSNVTPALPTSHPFNAVALGSSYWTSTTFENGSQTEVWRVRVSNGIVERSAKPTPHFVLPVRVGE